MNCANCGKYNKDSEDFCEHCGAALPKVTVQKSAMDAVHVYERKKAPKAEDSNKKLLTILMIVLLGLIFIGIVVASIFGIKSWLENSRDEEPEKRPSSSQVQKPTQEGPMTEDNPYYTCYKEYDAYVLPESSSYYINRTQLSELTKEELTIALQEIYARHGRVFSDKELQAYFDARSWYSAGGVTDLNTYEKANVILLDVYIAQLSGNYSQPGNPFLGLTTGNDSYLLEDSDSEYLESEALKDLTEKELILGRNELYARHGYVFPDEDLQTYFCTKSWYVPAGTIVSDSSLNEYESNNLKLIQMYERRYEGIEFDIDSPYMDYFASASDYILSSSDTREIVDTDLAKLKKEQCVLARNEIYARHDYAFDDGEILDYFLLQEWYNPGGKIGDSSKIELSSTEKKNIKILQEAEDVLEAMPEEIGSLNHSLTTTISYDTFSIQIPSYWNDYAVHNKTNMEFCEKVTNDNTDLDGTLFSLSVLPAEQEIQLPSYKLVGVLTNSEGAQFNLIAVYPTDVRFHVCAASLYQEMSGDIDRILATVTPADGYALAAP